MRISRLLIVALVLGAVIISAISFFVGLDRVAAALEGANYTFLAAAVFFQALAMIALFLRWDCIVRFKKIKVSNFSLFLATLSGAAFTNLAPGARYGGEPVRVFFLRRHSDAHSAESLATVIAERIFDAAAFILISAAVVILAAFRWHLPMWMVGLLTLALLLCTALLAVMIYVSLRKRAGMAFALWLIRRLRFIRRIAALEKMRGKLANDIERYSESVGSVLKNRSLWFFGFTYSALIWVFDVLRLYFVFGALGWWTSLPMLGAVLIISSLAGSIPIVPGGLGITEVAMMLVLASAGIGLVGAGMATLLDRLISYWAVTFIGIAATYYLGLQKYDAKASYLKGR